MLAWPEVLLEDREVLGPELCDLLIEGFAPALLFGEGREGRHLQESTDRRARSRGPGFSVVY